MNRAIVTAAAGLTSIALATAFAQAPPREAQADLPGVHLSYSDTGGNGAAVVFVHAATGSRRVWEYQVPAFTAAGYRVIAYDRRGFGRSTVDPAGPQPGTGADDLVALANHLKLDRFHLVGTAAGGIVSLDFAVSFPQRLRSLVVANSIGGVQDEDYVALGRRLRPSPQFDALPVEVREVGPAYRAADATGTARWVELSRQSRLARPLPSPQTFKNRVTFARLETIRVPTLLISGGADLYAPPPVMRLFADRMKGAETIAVPDAGHSTFWEQAELFNRTLLTFLKRH